MIRILQTRVFKNSYKKLKVNQKSDVDAAILEISKNLEIGQLKKGDLSGIRVYKFKVAKQLMLLAYTYEDEELILTLLAIGSHENFYRELKK
jgi:mRNA interferase RelE/StbE